MHANSLLIVDRQSWQKHYQNLRDKNTPKAIPMKSSFDQVAHIYDKTRGLQPEVMRKLVRTLIKELDKCNIVLEVGVGTGRLAKPLQENGVKVVGIDISRKMMLNAKRKDIDDLLLSDACFLPFRDSCFDAALSVHVLHLIRYWQVALGEICRVTKESLVSVITRPSVNPISEAYEELASARGYNVGHVGLGERDLTGIVKATKSIRAASTVSDADQHLTYLKQRAYSRQWKVPENVDKWIVKELVKRFAGRKYQLELLVLKWNVRDLKSRLK